MGQLGHQLNTHFQFELGDNFYESGVQSLNDTRFNVFKKLTFSTSPNTSPF
jgi:hypothetical protein